MERTGSESWPKDLANKSNCDGTGHGATGAAPSRMAVSISSSSLPAGASAPRHIAARWQQCQQDSAELASTGLLLSPHPAAGRPMHELTPRMTIRPERRGPRGMRLAVLWVGPLPRFGGRAPLMRHLCPPITGIARARRIVAISLLVWSGVWSVPVPVPSLTSPRPSVPRPSVQ
jgi:hypothetical protein